MDIVKCIACLPLLSDGFQPHYVKFPVGLILQQSLDLRCELGEYGAGERALRRHVMTCGEVKDTARLVQCCNPTAKLEVISVNHTAGTRLEVA